MLIKQSINTLPRVCVSSGTGTVWISAFCLHRETGHNMCNSVHVLKLCRKIYDKVKPSSYLWCPFCSLIRYSSEEPGMPYIPLQICRFKAFWGFYLIFSILHFLLHFREHKTFSTDLLSICKFKYLNWRNLQPLYKSWWHTLHLNSNVNNLARHFSKTG